MAGAAVVALPFLLLSLTIFFVARRGLGLDLAHLQTVAFVTLAFSTQATVYLVREPRFAWSSYPGYRLVAVSALVVIAVAILAVAGWLMASLSPAIVSAVLVSVAVWALLVDFVKAFAFRSLGLHRAA